jgi:hypothetical protein
VVTPVPIGESSPVAELLPGRSHGTLSIDIIESVVYRRAFGLALDLAESPRMAMITTPDIEPMTDPGESADELVVDTMLGLAVAGAISVDMRTAQ